jgi:hypothetical protein
MKTNIFRSYSGLSTSLYQFSAGRVIAGMGGAGMTSLLSSLIVRKFQAYGLKGFGVSDHGRSDPVERYCQLAVME